MCKICVKKNRIILWGPDIESCTAGRALGFATHRDGGGKRPIPAAAAVLDRTLSDEHRSHRSDMVRWLRSKNSWNSGGGIGALGHWQSVRICQDMSGGHFSRSQGSQGSQGSHQGHRPADSVITL